jgi:hypothetical protein
VVDISGGATGELGWAKPILKLLKPIQTFFKALSISAEHRWLSNVNLGKALKKISNDNKKVKKR